MILIKRILMKKTLMKKFFNPGARKLHFPKYKKFFQGGFFNFLNPDGSFLKYKKRIFLRKYHKFFNLGDRKFHSSKNKNLNLKYIYIFFSFERYKKFFRSRIFFFFFLKLGLLILVSFQTDWGISIKLRVL